MNELKVPPFKRRLKRISSAFAACCVCLLLTGQAVGGGAGEALTASAVYDPEPPVSRWGRGDEAGNSNTQTPAKVLQAVKLIKKGKKYPLKGATGSPGAPLAVR